MTVRLDSWIQPVLGRDRVAYYDMRRKTILVHSGDAEYPRFGGTAAVPVRRLRDDQCLRYLTIYINDQSNPELLRAVIYDAQANWVCLNASVIIDDIGSSGLSDLLVALYESGGWEADIYCSETTPVEPFPWVQRRGTNAEFHQSLERHRATRGTLCVDPELFRLLHFWSIDFGTLAVTINRNNMTGNAGPAVSRFDADRVSAESLGALIKSEPVQALWRAQPGDVKTCGGCVFRYACRNSRIFRSDVDPLSPPINCDLIK